MKLYVFVALTLLIVSCGKISNDIDLSPNPGKIIAFEIAKELFFKLAKEKQLYVCEYGGGGKKPIGLIHCGLNYYKPIEIEEARELLVTTTNQLLHAFNEDVRIHPYLSTYPFKPENVQIRIFLYNADGSLCAKEKLHAISNLRGRLDYMNECPDKRWLQKVLVETFEEAEAKLKAPMQQAI